jgi:hypothetical protein
VNVSGGAGAKGCSGLHPKGDAIVPLCDEEMRCCVEERPVGANNQDRS